MSPPRCYTVAQLLDVLLLTPRTFFRRRQAGDLPFLEELHPRIGRSPRYRADLVDRYLAGQWGQSRLLASHRKLAS
jgi:hypothetical protein